MPNRTQIVCLHEGEKGHSIDPVFINRLLKDLAPPWLRPWSSNIVRLVACGGRTELIGKMADELKACLKVGSNTTLMVWADLDHNMPNGDTLKDELWQEAEKKGITSSDFENIVFIFPKDRLENWIDFLITGVTDESLEGPRVEPSKARIAAQKLADMCKTNQQQDLPPSLEWSCQNWRALVKRMK